MSSPYNVIGVVCRDSYFPAPTITIVEQANRLFFIYPNSDTEPRTAPQIVLCNSTLEDIEKSDHFHLCAPTTSSDDIADLLSFAFNEKAIVIGTMSNIADSIEMEFTNCTQDEVNFGKGQYKFLSDYIFGLNDWYKVMCDQLGRQSEFPIEEVSKIAQLEVSPP